MKGVKPEDVPKLEKLITDSLEKIANEGFEPDDIASSMNTIEFQMRGKFNVLSSDCVLLFDLLLGHSNPFINLSLRIQYWIIPKRPFFHARGNVQMDLR
jgi:Zn-dependent M16 (insulinase) family peptidase